MFNWFGFNWFQVFDKVLECVLCKQGYGVENQFLWELFCCDCSVNVSLHDKGNKLSSVRKLSVFHLENYSITLQLPVGFMLILEITDSDVSSFVK